MHWREVAQPGATRGFTDGYVKRVDEVAIVGVTLLIGADVENGEIEPKENLQPGVRYCAKVKFSNFIRRGPDIHGWAISQGPARLRLFAENYPELATHTDATDKANVHEASSIVLVSADEMAQHTSTFFHFYAPPGNCGFDYLVLCIEADSPTRRSRPILMARRCVALDIRKEPLDFNVMKAFEVDLSSSVPENAAYLHAVQISENIIQLRGWNAALSTRDYVNISIDRSISPALNIDRGIPPNIILECIYAYSVNQLTEIALWLSALISDVSRDGGPLCVMICDSTDAEIPWELLYIETPNIDGFLGALAVVARWTHIKRRSKPVNLSTAPIRKMGTAMGYLDGSIASTTETMSLSNMKAVLYENMHSLIDAVEVNTGNVGLLYIGSHGKFVSTPGSGDQFHMLYGTSDTSNNVLDVDIWMIRSDRSLIPLAFVNACHSGRLRPDTGGLPLPFLSKICDGYIGTLGKVPQAVAGDIGSQILRRLYEQQPVGNVLLQLRKEASSKTTLDKIRRYKRNANFDDDIDVEGFLFTCMYVYYGNPNIVLCLGDCLVAK